MRRTVLFAVMMILVGSCTSDDGGTSSSFETTIGVTAGFDASTTTGDIGEAPVDSEVTPPSASPATSGTEVSGALPDGTAYTVGFDRPVATGVEGINGVVMFDVDGRSQVLGITRFWPNRSASGARLDDLTYTVSVDGWSVSIAVYPEVAELIPDLAGLMTSSITPGVGGTLPTLRLASPLRWAAEDEVPSSMEVLYKAFVVRRGCGQLAVACSVTGAVQVISADQIRSPADPLGAEPVSIESTDPADACQTAVFASGRPNPDAQAETSDDIEVWALFYPTTVGDLEGEPIVIDATDVGPDSPIRETKIVWRATGDTEEFAEIGRSPSGEVVEPISQQRHTDSQWNRPGHEWGTGWELTEPGCWTFVVTRGSASAEINVEVRESEE